MTRSSFLFIVIPLVLTGCAELPCPPGTSRTPMGRCLTAADATSGGAPGGDASVAELPPSFAANPSADLPAELDVLPAATELHLRVGASLDLSVELRAPGSHPGVVRLEVLGLPPGVLASAAFVTEPSTAGVVSVRAGADAPVGGIFEVALQATVLGNATVSGSAPLTLRVLGPAGHLDEDFAAAGALVAQPLDGTADSVRAIVAMDGGGFALAGNGRDASARRELRAAFVTAYEADGAVRPGFGAGGTRFFDHPSVDATEIHSAIGQPDGMLVGLREDSSLRVIRLDGAGATDRAFGAGTGAALRPTARGGLRLHAYGDGFILGGAADIECYDADGVLDPLFGDGGVLRGTSASGAALAALPDGGIVLGWHDWESAFSFEAFDAAGGPRDDFAGTGPASIEPASSLGAVAAVVPVPGSAEGAVVAALSVPASSGTFGAVGVRLVRLTATGAVDPSFGAAGLAALAPADRGYGGTAEATGMALAGDRLLVWGQYWRAGERAALGAEVDMPRGYLAAFTLDGQVDRSFGVDGSVALGLRLRPVAVLALTSAHRVVVAGDRRSSSLPDARRDILVQRFWL